MLKTQWGSPGVTEGQSPADMEGISGSRAKEQSVLGVCAPLSLPQELQANFL
jgi:hypothetical protein